MSFVDVVTDQDDREEAYGHIYHVQRMLLHPEQWKKYPNRTGLSWQGVQFSKQNTTRIPDKAIGVYSFVVVPGIASHPRCAYLLYVGKVRDQGFRARFKQYLRELTTRKPRPHVTKMLRNWQEFLWFYYAPITNKALVDQAEEDLLAALIPPYNHQFPASVSKLVKAVFS